MYETPIIKLDDESNELYVKRDDMLPFSFGGNKVRIALAFIEDMRAQGKDCIVGYGNARSNLSRALSNLCCQHHIPCHIISPADEDGARITTYNSEMVKSFDATFHFCSKTNVKKTVEDVLAQLQKEGLKPYYIYGDSNGKGNEHIPLKAYAGVYEEIRGQFDYIFLATGTGMTQGGLLVGKARHSGRERIVGVSVARATAYETEILRSMLTAYCERVESIDIPEISVLDGYLCGGYGKYDRNIEKTIADQLKNNGMPLDPTYTGKAFFGMLDYLQKNNITGKRVLFIHTGGAPLFFDYMQGLRLTEIHDKDDILNAIMRLEGCLSPSLSQREVDLQQYAEKLYRHGRVWCYLDHGQPVAMIAGYFNDSKGRTAYITILAVDEKHRGLHLASSLLCELEEFALASGMDKVKLEVRKNNHVARKLYTKFGYGIFGDASDTSCHMIKYLKVKS